MLQADSIVAAVTTAFATNPNMQSLCPGGLWHRRAPGQDQTVAAPQGDSTGKLRRPYAILDVVPDDEREFITDYSCVQSFLIKIRIFGDQTVSNTGMAASYLSDWDFNRSIFLNLPAKTLALFPAAEAIDLDPEEKAGEDVVVASRAWSLLLHYATQTTPT